MKKNQPLTEEQIKEYKELKRKYLVEGENLTKSEKKLFLQYNIQVNKDKIHELRQDMEKYKEKLEKYKEKEDWWGVSLTKSDIQKLSEKIKDLKREIFDISHPMLSKITDCIKGTGAIFTDVMTVGKEEAKEKKDDFMYMQLMIDD